MVSDRLSELPDSLLFLILSFLPEKDAARASLLSKRYCTDRWTTLPYLYFVNSDMNIDRFRRFVNRSLALWEGTKILKFKIECVFDLSLFRDIDSWLRFAIEKQVEELHLGFVESFYGRRKFDYTLPKGLYFCESITKLTLVGCSLFLNAIENVQWKNLRSLRIEGDAPMVREGVLGRILSGSPQLEELDLRIREGDHSDNFGVISRSLKVLKIARYLERLPSPIVPNMTSEMVIWTPNLERLEISGHLYRRCFITAPSLTTVILSLRDFDYMNQGRYSEREETLPERLLRSVLRRISHVENLTLSLCCIKILLGLMEKPMALLPELNSRFLSLSVRPDDDILRILTKFPLLQSLHLVSEFDRTTSSIDDFSSRLRLESTACPPLPQLKEVEITWDMRRHASIFRVITYLLRNAGSLEKLVFRLMSFGDFPRLLSLAEEKLLSIPTSSPTAKVVIIKDRSKSPSSLSLPIQPIYLCFGKRVK